MRNERVSFVSDTAHQTWVRQPYEFPDLAKLPQSRGLPHPLTREPPPGGSLSGDHWSPLQTEVLHRWLLIHRFKIRLMLLYGHSYARLQGGSEQAQGKIAGAGA